ncbi:predicted protein [Chaetoceros tenuissimus]|uniref:Uncharacterized protein n=1 Tax=Chaetoceros tenuissimus TaxID=426638 RepID=A0AAD3CFT3_9STRA|nr:predicted protein [Chaetoceros tenuissimus]
MPTPVIVNTEANEMSQNENKNPVDYQLASTKPKEESTSRSPSKDAIGFSPPKSSSRRVQENNTTIITSKSPSGSKSKLEDEKSKSLKILSVSKIYYICCVLCCSMSLRSVVKEEMQLNASHLFYRRCKGTRSSLQ